MRIVAWVIGSIAVILTGFMLLTAGWERPPIHSEQSGYRGTGMVDVVNPRVDPARLQGQLDQVPDMAPLPPDTGGPTAGQVYQNVQVLGDLSVARFTRVMQAMTDWVTPELGCAGCHNLQNLADDSVYRKGVSRRMIQMTQAVNSDWSSHVGATGVTCYTCHRGNNVPEYAWFNADPDIYGGQGLIGWRNGQNRASESVGLTSMPEDPFSGLIEDAGAIRIAGDTALPDGEPGSSIQSTEQTYALMIHMSEALDVNCTYCHNSRAFSSWEQSSPQRVTAWHGLEMTKSLNADHVAPVSGMLPAERLGPTGEGRKVNCETCHQGVNKPLGGLSMAEMYPSLLGPSGPSAAAVTVEEENDAVAGAPAPEGVGETGPADL